MPEPLHILLVEDNAGDALLLEETLLDVPNFAFTLEHVTSAGAAVERLGRGGIDAVLLDLSLPDAHGLETVQKVYPAALRVPLVVLSGTSDERTATLSLKEGAQDYLIKGESGGRVIARTLTYALERNRMALDLKEAHTRAEVLAALADSLHAARTPSGVSQSVVETLGPALEASFMFTMRTGEGRVWLDATWGEVHPAIRTHFQHPGFTVAGTVLLSDPTTKATGVYSEMGGSELWTVPGFPQLSFAAEPILRTAQKIQGIQGGGELEGFITTWRPSKLGAWTAGERELLQRSAAAVSLALEKAELSAALEMRNSQLEERITLALQAAQMVAWDWDMLTDRVTFSQSVRADAAGELQKSLSAADTWSMVHPDDFERYQAHLEQLRSGVGEERGSIQVRVRRLGSEDYFWAEEQSLVRRSALGKVIGMSGITLNINERILAEGERDRLFRELETERLQLEAILTELPVGVATVEAGSGRILMTNRQAQAILGNANLNSPDFEDYVRYGGVHPDGSPFQVDDYPMTRAVRYGKYERDVVFDYLRGDGEAIVLSTNTGPLPGQDGSVRGAVAVFIDITERVRAEREREKLISDLEHERLRLEAILTELPVGVILADGVSGEVLMSNPESHALLKRDLSRTDGLGQQDECIFFYPDGTPVPLEDLPAARAIHKKEYVREQELLYQRSKGEQIILSINTGPVGGDIGASAGFVITLRDITERRTASKRIEASEARFQMYANNIQDALYISSPETNQIQYLSPAFQRIWELEPSSVLENWAGTLDAVHPADRGKVEQTFRQHWQDGFDIEYRLLRGSGEVRWIRDRGFPLEGLQSVAGIAQDITKRKQAELELIQSEERLLLALESSGVVFFEWNENGGVVEFQGAADLLFGLKKGSEGLPIAEFLDLILEEDRQTHLSSVRESLRNFDRYATDIRIRRGGQIRWIQGRGKVIYSGGNPIINGVFLDITERKLAELARTESEERLQLALNSSGVVFWQWVESRQKIIFDGLASALFGLPPETRYMDASTFLNLILEEDRTTFERSIQQAFETLERHATDIRILRRGQIRWVQVRGKVALEDGIQVINGVFLDITERKLIELRLRELNEAQKRFVSDAAHELRAPLTSIQGNLELVRLYPQMPPDEQLEAIGDAEREAARLGRLVADLLTLARGDRGVEMMEDDLKLNEVLQEAWRSALLLGRNHWMELLTLEECRVLGDRDRLKQLTLILLENALKYTPPDGKITLELKCLEGHVEFRVSDNGVGIAETDLERVFERFYRTDEARVRGEDPGGTGLGLSIGQWIAELHGGKVWLERADAGGTVAVVRLPRLELEG